MLNNLKLPVHVIMYIYVVYYFLKTQGQRSVDFSDAEL